MADATKMATLSELTYFAWSTPAAPNPRLSAPINSTETTISFTSAPLDSAGAVITTAFLMGVKNSNSYVETIYCPNGADGTSGLSATGCVRGIELEGIDFTVGDTTNAAAHEQDSPVFCNITAVVQHMMIGAVQGTIATGGSGIIIGTDASGTTTISRSTGAGTTAGFYRWNSTNSKAEFSNDGSSWDATDNVTGSNLVVVTGADTTASNLQTKVNARGGLAESVGSAGGNETLDLDVDLTSSTGNITAGLLATVISDVTATVTEVNQVLDGVSANVTDTNLNTLTAGSSSNADSLHTHQNPTISFVAAEAITADDAVALLPVEVEFFAQLTDADQALGSLNSNRRFAIQFVPSVTTSSLTTMLFRAKENSAGNTAYDLDISIQLDSSGDPSGTPIANGSATQLTAAGDLQAYGGNHGNRTATWASPPTLTAGTTYWLVFQASSTQAANHLVLSVNSSHDEDYITFTRSTFDLDAGTWGNDVTNATPFFWFDNQVKLLGMKVVQTDANFGGRTWPFIGFARTTVAADASVDVYYSIATALSSLTPGASVYLSATAGAITTTPPIGLGNDGTAPTSFQYKIGRAISTTELKIETGQKRVIYIEDATITGTTTRQYISWFKPETAKVYGVNINVGNDGSYSMGFVQGDGSDLMVSLESQNAGPNVGDGNVTQSFFGPDSTNGFAGAGSAMTDVGLTYTYTETGNATARAIVEIIG